MALSIAAGTAGTAWRRMLVPLIVTSGVTLAWVMARRRQVSGSVPRSWSELDVAAPAALRPAVPDAAPPAVVESPDAEMAAPDAPAVVDGPVPGPYPGSVLPLADGSAPSGEFVVKGNAGSMRSHPTDSPYFGRTRAEVWFRTQEDAAAAGFAPWAPKK